MAIFQTSAILTLSIFHALDGVSFLAFMVSFCTALYVLSVVNERRFDKSENVDKGFAFSALDRREPYFCAFVALTILFVFILLRNSIVPDLNWDAVTYGYPRAALWLHNATVLADMPSRQNAIFVDEWLGEFIGLPYALITGTVGAVMFGQTEVYILFAMSIFLLGRRFSEDPAASLTTAALLCSTPCVLGLAASYKGDLLAAAGLVFCAYWVDGIKNSRHPILIFCLSVWSAALATGAKLSAFGPSAFLGMFALLQLWRHQREKAAKATILAFIGSLILMSRYCLNLFYYHNPVIRSAAESSAAGLTLENLIGNSAVIFEHFIYQEKSNSEFFCLSAGLGLSGIIIVSLSIINIPRIRISPRERTLLVITVMATLLMMAAIWARGWSFRYFLPGMAVILTILGSKALSQLFRFRSYGAFPIAIAAVSALNLISVNKNGQLIGWQGWGNSFARYNDSTPLEFINNRQIKKDLVEKFSLDAPAGKKILMNVGFDSENLLFVGSHSQNDLIHVATPDQVRRALTDARFDFVVYTHMYSSEFMKYINSRENDADADFTISNKFSSDRIEIPVADIQASGYTLAYTDEEYVIFAKN